MKKLFIYLSSSDSVNVAADMSTFRNSNDLGLTQKPKLTKGQYRVGIDFNPGGSENVRNIKAHAAEFIDFMEAISDESNNSEVKRLVSLAQTHIEDAAMWGVKAATKPAQ